MSNSIPSPYTDTSSAQPTPKMSSSPGAASFSTLSSYASSAPDRQESHAGNFPLPVTATAPTTTTGTTHLSPSSAPFNSKYVQTPSSANAANAANANASNPPNNSSNSITPNHTPDARDTPNHHLHLRPRTATLNYKLLPHLETGLHTNSLDDHICQLHYRDTIYNHPIQEFFSSVSSSSFSSMYHPSSSSSSSSSSNNNNYDYTDEEKGGVNEEREPELGWRDAYEVMVKAPLRGLAALARRMRWVRVEREEGKV